MMIFEKIEKLEEFLKRFHFIREDAIETITEALNSDLGIKHQSSNKESLSDFIEREYNHSMEFKKVDEFENIIVKQIKIHEDSEELKKEMRDMFFEIQKEKMSKGKA